MLFCWCCCFFQNKKRYKRSCCNSRTTPRSHWGTSLPFLLIVSWFKVIPLKLFYYQTFFETSHNQHSWYEHGKKCNKKMGSPCLFTRQQSLKLGYFYWLRVKHSNPLLTELSLCYLKHTKFYLEHKASFIQISSIASFNSFLIAWLWGYCTFSDSSVVSLKSSPWPKYTKYETIFPQKIMFYYQTFFLLQICSLLDCS